MEPADWLFSGIYIAVMLFAPILAVRLGEHLARRVGLLQGDRLQDRGGRVRAGLGVDWAERGVRDQHDPVAGQLPRRAAAEEADLLVPVDRFAHR